MYIYIYIYIYTHVRERERERENFLPGRGLGRAAEARSPSSPVRPIQITFMRAQTLGCVGRMLMVISPMGGLLMIGTCQGVSMNSCCSACFCHAIARVCH